MNCPKCPGISLEEIRSGDLAIDRCPSCHGIWLDILELERVIESDPRALLAEDSHFTSIPGETGPRVNCPRCKGSYLIKLNSRQRPGTIVDSCTVCYGTGLDAGELTRLAHAEVGGWVRSLFGRT